MPSGETGPDGGVPAAADAQSTRIGCIGLGSMGAPMARRLLAHPGGLTVCDVRAEAMEQFAAAGAHLADTPAEAAHGAGIVCVTVLDDAQVRRVVAGPDGILAAARPPAVVAVHSTISDTAAAELAAQFRAAGVELVDAPVSGGAAGARSGELAVMVGGTDAAFAAVRGPFALFAGLVVHAGAVGAGTRMKLARNLLHFVSFTAAAEAQRLAEACGLDVAALGAVVRHSDAVTGGPGAIMLRGSTVPVDPGDPLHPILVHVRDLGEKDLDLALGLGGREHVDLPLARRALAGLGAGLGVGPGFLAEAADDERKGNA